MFCKFVGTELTTDGSHTVQCTDRTSLMNLCERRQIYNPTWGCMASLQSPVIFLFIALITLMVLTVVTVPNILLRLYYISLLYEWFLAGPKTKLTVRWRSSGKVKKKCKLIQTGLGWPGTGMSTESTFYLTFQPFTSLQSNLSREITQHFLISNTPSWQR